jgi:hypothetical protein
VYVSGDFHYARQRQGCGRSEAVGQLPWSSVLRKIPSIRPHLPAPKPSGNLTGETMHVQSGAHDRKPRFVIGLFAAFALSSPGLAMGATKCVNPGGTGGCYPTITSAVTAASPNDTIQVAPGTYREDVVVT